MRRLEGMYDTNHFVSIDGGDPDTIRSERVLWNREVLRRGGRKKPVDSPSAIGFAAAVRFLYERPSDQPVFLFYDRGWGDQPGIAGTWEFCPIDGNTYDGQHPIVTVARQAVWLLAKHGFLDHNTYGGFKARRVHDVKLRPEREWFLACAAAVEAGHAAGVAFARAEIDYDEEQRVGAKRRRDRLRRRARRTERHDLAAQGIPAGVWT